MPFRFGGSRLGCGVISKTLQLVLLVIVSMKQYLRHEVRVRYGEVTVRAERHVVFDHVLALKVKEKLITGSLKGGDLLA